MQQLNSLTLLPSRPQLESSINLEIYDLSVSEAVTQGIPDGLDVLHCTAIGAIQLESRKIT